MGKATQFFAGALAMLGIGMAAPAAAEPILLDNSKVGESYTITFDGFVNGGPSLEGLSGELVLTLTSIAGGIYNFDYAMTNTGADGDGITSRISSFAFNTDPDIDSATSTGTFGFTTLDSNYPNGIGTVDVCFKGRRTGSCAGGGSAGVFDGETGSGTLSLDFGDALSSVTLSDFFVRYQSITGIDGVGSASGRETSTSSSTGGTNVPAPGMLIIFALAMLALMRKTIARGVPPRSEPQFA